VNGGAPCGCGQAACGCCEGVGALTPLPTENRPGLGALAVRIGTHGSFLATLKARLSTHALGEGPTAARPLAALGVRDSDGSIGLLDAFATMADVLTFYQERIVNEGYLRTATTMRSVQELARLVGYERRPGLGSSVWLHYTLDSNTSGEVTIPAGAQVQTVPGPGELPQTFETSDKLVARAAWNRLGVRRTEPTRWNAVADTHDLYLAGTSTRLKPGDPLLVGLGTAAPKAFRILLVQEDPDLRRTRIEIEPWEGVRPAVPRPPAAIVGAIRELVATRRDAPTGQAARDILEMIKDIKEPDPDEEVTDADLKAALPALRRLRESIAKRLKQVPNLPQAKKLSAWAAKVDRALGRLIEAIERHLQPPDCNLESLVGKLTVPPAAPPSHPLKLRGTLSERFEESGAAGLTMLAQASPNVGEQLAAGLSGCRAQQERAPPISVYALRLRASLFGHNAAKQRKTVNALSDQDRLEQTTSTVEIGEWPIVSSVGGATGNEIMISARDPKIVKREAPDRLDLDGSHDGILSKSWLLVDMTAVPEFDDLPAVAGGPPARPGAAVTRAAPSLVAQVRSARAGVSRADYGLTGGITRLSIAEPGKEGWITIAPDEVLRLLLTQEIADRDYQVIRGTTVYAASEALEIAESPIADPVCDGSTARAPIELDGLYLGLEPGRFVMVSGERADIEHVGGVTGSEAAMIASVVHDVRADVAIPIPWTTARRMTEAAALAAAAARSDDSAVGRARAEPPPGKLAGDTMHTFIWLEKPLAYCYARESVAIHANLVKATHGESHEEALGSGDGTRPNQSFTLKHPPLTYLPAPTPSGAAETLRVFVNNIRWNAVASFVDLPATARSYSIRTDHLGVSSVVFGDGIEGARLPTGTINVTASYRSGLGRAGNVRAGQVQQLVTRPLGVKEVTNPFRASGGADPESRDQARRNAPLATAALGRLVAVRDYADFARTFAGIAKADARELSDGTRSVVHVTVAALDDAPVDPTGDLLSALRTAYRDLGDPFQAVVVEPRELRLLVVQAGVRIDPDRRWEVVAAGIREALFDTFGFERRELGQGVAASELVNVIQAVEGVAMVDLELFGAIPTMTTASDGTRRPLTPGESEGKIQEIIAMTRKDGVARKVDARLARRDGAKVLPAELVMLSSDLTSSLMINQVGEKP
jgi:predicted phage baseplate assembly protein